MEAKKKKRRMRSRRSRSRASRKSRGAAGNAWSSRLCTLINTYADQADQLHSELQRLYPGRMPVMLIGRNNIEEKINNNAPLKIPELRNYTTQRLKHEAQKIREKFPFTPTECVVFSNGDPKRMLHRERPRQKPDTALHPWMFVIEALIDGGYRVVSGSTSEQKLSLEDLFVDKTGTPIPHIQHGTALSPQNAYLSFDHVIYPNVENIFKNRKQPEPTSTLYKTLEGLNILYRQNQSIPNTDDGESNRPGNDSIDPMDYFVPEDQHAYFHHYVSNSEST